MQTISNSTIIKNIDKNILIALSNWLIMKSRFNMTLIFFRLTASLRQDTQKLVSGKSQHEKDKLENCLSGFPSLSKRLQQITEQGMQLLRYGNTSCGVFKGGIQN